MLFRLLNTFIHPVWSLNPVRNTVYNTETQVARQGNLLAIYMGYP